jgi:glycosyltransferase involved in cell wall biosynthesis
MRIVQAVGWYLPESLGGTELYVARLAARLLASGHDVLVAAPDPNGVEERRSIVDNVPVYRYPIARTVSRAQARGHEVVPGAERFHLWLAAMRPDVVHFHTFVTGLALREIEAARKAGARIIVTSHAGSLGFLCERGTLMRDGRHLCDGAVADDVCAACALQMRGVPGAGLVGRSPAWLATAALGAPGRVGTVVGMRALIADNRRAQAELFSHIDAFVVLSEFARRALIATGAPEDKVFLNRLGVQPSTNRPAQRSAPDSTTVFGFVGRAEAIKGLDDAVRAVVSIPQHVAIRLRAVVVCGNDEERSLLQRCRALARNDSRVSFEDPVAPQEIPRLLASIDILLCPSRAVEGGPTIALEAHAAGTPVVGSNLPALNEIVTHEVNGLLHEPGDWRQLAAYVTQIAAAPSATIDAWRSRLTAPRTHDDVAREYLLMYTAEPRLVVAQH